MQILKPYQLKGYLKDYREKYSLTQEGLATLIGVHRVTLNRWETMQTKSISPAWYKILVSMQIVPKKESGG